MVPYEVTYPGNTCDNEVPQHQCNPCEPTEKGRVRAVAFVNKSYKSTLEANPDDAAVWQDGIQSGAIRIIPEVSGTYDGGSKATQAGYGDQKERVTGRNCTLVYKDPNYKDNCAFYTELEQSRNWHAVWKTETLIHISDVVASVFAKNPASDNLEDDVVWEVEVTWFQKAPACPLAAPAGIFDCFTLS